MRIFSNQTQYLMSIWECLKFDPATWKENTKKLTPKIVTKSTLSPKMKRTWKLLRLGKMLLVMKIEFPQEGVFCKL